MSITWIGSPNYDKARKPIDRIVIHWMVGTLAGTDAQFQKPNGTSAHYGIEDENVHQYVKEEHVAYHAGVYAMNQRSIGIEHSAAPDRPATEKTYNTSARLIAEICQRYSITPDRTHIIKHSEVKATQCPGTMDLDKLINLTKKHMANTITIETKLYEKLVGGSTVRKEVAEYLKIDSPDDAPKERILNAIQGIQSAVTSAQRERDAAVTEMNNKRAELSRVQDQLMISVNAQEALSRQAKQLQDALDKQGRVVGGLESRIAELETENRELKKDVVTGLDAAELIRLGILKFLRIK